jgi:hypothetical protein
MVSPQLELLIAFWKAIAFPAGIFHTVPVCVGMVKFTVACGSVGNTELFFTDPTIVKLTAPDFVGSATLVAVMVTVAGDRATIGAV